MRDSCKNSFRQPRYDKDEPLDREQLFAYDEVGQFKEDSHG